MALKFKAEPVQNYLIILPLDLEICSLALSGVVLGSMRRCLWRGAAGRNMGFNIVRENGPEASPDAPLQNALLFANTIS